MFMTAAGPTCFRGTIAAISADNPASCNLGGFKESSSAYRPCRQCMGTKEECQEEVSFFTINHANFFIYAYTVVQRGEVHIKKSGGP